jgi:tRNA pseudouridine13 synthase
MDSDALLNVSDLKQAIIQPPFITERLPGIGGVLKAIPEHFQVEEELPYAPCGEGEHVFVKLRRAGWNTTDVATALGRVFDLKGSDIGWGGRKDKNAVTTQTISLRLPLELSLTQIEDRIKPLLFEIIDIQRHRNKLKTGHVAANRFRIVLSGVVSCALERAEAIAVALKDSGVPNYYGEQRFGHHYLNLDRAVTLVKRKKAHGKKDTFMVSVLQSALYNCWLIERIRRGEFGRLLQGDVARKTDTGGLFIVDDLDEAARRFAAREITYTGPIFGHKMMSAIGPAGDCENRLLQRFGLDLEVFKPLRAPGSRRPAILYLHDLTVKPVIEGLEFAFTLPSGAYATTVLREFTRASGGAAPEI